MQIMTLTYGPGADPLQHKWSIGYHADLASDPTYVFDSTERAAALAYTGPGYASQQQAAHYLAYIYYSALQQGDIVYAEGRVTTYGGSPLAIVSDNFFPMDTWPSDGAVPGRGIKNAVEGFTGKVDYNGHFRSFMIGLLNIDHDSDTFYQPISEIGSPSRGYLQTMEKALVGLGALACVSKAAAVLPTVQDVTLVKSRVMRSHRDAR
jgi:hypothetical protein